MSGRDTVRAIGAHLAEQYSQALGVTGWRSSGTDRDPRFTGTDGTDTVVVEVRFCRYENAGKYRGWLTIGAGGARAARTQRPAGFRFYSLVVGLLPDGSPWWSALWDMAPVVADWDRVVESMHDGYWFRVNPGLMPREHRPVVYDFIQQTLGLEEPPEVEADILVRLVEWEDSIGSLPAQELEQVDAVMLRVRRMIRSEKERRGSLVGAGA